MNEHVNIFYYTIFIQKITKDTKVIKIKLINHSSKPVSDKRAFLDISEFKRNVEKFPRNPLTYVLLGSSNSFVWIF